MFTIKTMRMSFVGSLFFLLTACLSSTPDQTSTDSDFQGNKATFAGNTELPKPGKIIEELEFSPLTLAIKELVQEYEPYFAKVCSHDDSRPTQVIAGNFDHRGEENDLALSNFLNYGNYFGAIFLYDKKDEYLRQEVISFKKSFETIQAECKFQRIELELPHDKKERFLFMACDISGEVNEACYVLFKAGQIIE